MSDRVTVSITNGVADVRFNRPDKRNALDAEQFAWIAAAGERLKSEAGVRVVVLSGEGESFCAGLDFAVFAEMGDQNSNRDEAGSSVGRLTASGITHLAQQVCWVWQEIDVPVIAAVHGHALGGGLQIALGADIRIAHPNTQWSVREVHWGLVPDMTGTFTLSRLVRSDIARELTYTARVFGGVEAFEIGLVTKLSENPYDDAMAMAREIAARSPGAIRGSKGLFNELFTSGAAAHFEQERRRVFEQIGSPNQREAVTANLEKRPPIFAD